MTAASIEGVTKWLRSDSGDCVCCEGPHVFTRLVRLPDDAPATARAHRGAKPDIGTWLHRMIGDAPEGARVRITVEMVEDVENDAKAVHDA